MSEFMPESWWKIEVPKLQNLMGRQHPMPAARQQRTGLTLWELDARSGRDELGAVATYAQYWARELDEIPPFHARGQPDWERFSAWVWTQPGRIGWRFTVVAAATFTRDDSTSSRTPCWSLQFVWAHPFSRHRGVWAEAWLLFLQRFLLLRIEP